MKARYWAVAALCGAWGVSVACTNTRDVAGSFVEPDSGPTSSFTTPDAAPADDDAGLVEYCAATSCQAPFTTCPGSHFLCDVNLMTDTNNCGACGIACPADSSGLAASFSCNAGKCIMTCTSHDALDCNGDLDDGCETKLGTNDNCNGCGETCPDPAKPCVWDPLANTGTCGCKDPSQTRCSGACVDVKSSDQNCGACGKSCNPAGDGGTPPTNAYFGCLESECGHLKCKQNYGDCDGDQGNGCEADLFETTNCGGCGIVCDPGQKCVADSYGQPTCMCPAGKTLCGNKCVDVATDPFNCGGCDVNCTKSGTASHGSGFCSYGSCVFGCTQGWGDCNADPKDGCETNFDSDPLNCGGCGNTCDVLAGQPCLGGRCAVEPCGPGGPTK